MERAMKPSPTFLALALLLGSAFGQEEPPPVLPPSQDKPPAWLVDSPRQQPARPVFRVGGDVTAPRVLYSPNPKYPKASRKAHQQGAVVLWLIVSTKGLPRDVRIARGLTSELNEAAIDAVKQWKFDPATRDGKPVAVQINIEVSFRLY